MKIHKHSWLSTWILKTLNSKRSQWFLMSKNLKKLTFSNSNSHCLEQILCFILIIALLPFGFAQSRVVAASISSLAIYEILFSFSWLAIKILFWNLSTHSLDFQHKTISGIFVPLSKKLPYFWPHEVILY